MNVIQEIKRINERELEQGVSGKASWHYEYKDSAWVFAGGFPYDLTEGDILCVMSQWGEIEDINLCREKDTGKSKVIADIMGRLYVQWMCWKRNKGSGIRAFGEGVGPHSVRCMYVLPLPAGQSNQSTNLEAW